MAPSPENDTSPKAPDKCDRADKVCLNDTAKENDKDAKVRTSPHFESNLHPNLPPGGAVLIKQRGATIDNLRNIVRQFAIWQVTYFVPERCFWGPFKTVGQQSGPNWCPKWPRLKAGRPISFPNVTADVPLLGVSICPLPIGLTGDRSQFLCVPGQNMRVPAPGLAPDTIDPLYPPESAVKVPVKSGKNRNFRPWFIRSINSCVKTKVNCFGWLLLNRLNSDGVGNPTKIETCLITFVSLLIFSLLSIEVEVSKFGT